MIDLDDLVYLVAPDGGDPRYAGPFVVLGVTKLRILGEITWTYLVYVDAHTLQWVDGVACCSASEYVRRMARLAS